MVVPVLTLTPTFNPVPVPPEVSNVPLEYPDPMGRVGVPPTSVACNVLTTPVLVGGFAIVTVGEVP